MKAIPLKSKKAVVLSKRRPFQRVDEKTKLKIVEQIKSGLISCMGASRKYRIPRNSIKAWAGKFNLTTLLNEEIPSQPSEMTQNQESRLLLRKIHELSKALELSQLKNMALETMIEVAESDFHIRIKKKRGAKQS